MNLNWVTSFGKRMIGFLALLIAPVAWADAGFPESLQIKHETHVLPNGLTLILHQDHKAPLVAVNMWYHVGSKDEQPGRTGFAHLFEHLMFNGSENHNDEFFRPLEPAGAAKINGTTWYDRTNYFQNVPTSALDLTLFLESDRMGHLLGVVDQARLDEQRGVVLNEKRQGENRPYGRVYELIAKSIYPAEHPYSWTTIGSEADLNAASLDDVKDWFRTHYGAANAVLVIAGDIDPEHVKKRVEHYFGDIPAGPPRDKHGPWVAKMRGSKRATMQDRVPQSRLMKVWNVPGYCAQDFTLLDIASEVLAGGKNSRLYKRLVYQDQLATSVSAGMGPFEIGSQFMIDVMLRPGADLAEVEAAVDEELQTLLAKGPKADELRRVRVQMEAGFIRGLERIDGFGGKSAMLARNQVYCGSADHYQQQYLWVTQAKPKQVREIARQWLSDGQFVLTVTPFDDYQVADQGADRSRLPETDQPPALQLPALERSRLSNGIEVVLAKRAAVPVVQMTALFDAGYAADASAKAGTAKMTLDMLDEGTQQRDALEIAADAEALGLRISAGSNLDGSFIGMNTLKRNLADSLDLFSEVLTQPSFPEKELQRLRQQRLAQIKQEKAQPVGIATRLYPALLFGNGHAYAQPRSGNGDEASVTGLTPEDLRGFYQRWIRPERATLLVVGDTSMEQMRPLLEDALGDWQAPETPLSNKQLQTVQAQTNPRLFLVNRPAAAQSLILAAQLAPPRADPDDVAMRVANAVIGGSFISRLNLNLREDKHWSYGARTVLGDAKAQRAFIAYAPVQADKTAESVREIERELREIIGDRGVTPEELKHAADSLVVGLPGEHETAGEIAGSFLNILQYGLPDDYYNALVPAVRELDLEKVNAAAKRLIQPDSLTWVIVGDLEKIEAPLRELNVGEVQILDVDGNLVGE